MSINSSKSSKSKSKPKVKLKPAQIAEKNTDTSRETAVSPLLSISEIAARLKVNRNTIARRLAAAGIHPEIDLPNKKLYELTEALEDVLLDDGTDPRMKAARLVKLKLETELKQFELGVRRGDLIQVSEVTAETIRICGGLYRKIVVNLPSRIARNLHEADSAKELEKLLSAEIQQIFDDVRGDNPKFLTEKGS